MVVILPKDLEGKILFSGGTLKPKPGVTLTSSQQKELDEIIEDLKKHGR